MTTVLVDHTRQLQKRWLLQNSPAIPLGIFFAATLMYCPNVTTRLVICVLIALSLYVVICGAIFRRFLMDDSKQQVICEYSILGMVDVARKQIPIKDAVAVTYSTWQTPYGHSNMSYHAAIYLRFKSGKPWRICDQANYSLDLECDEAMADQLASMLGLPLLKDNHDPASNRING